MREFLFRGKRTDNGTWTCGYLFCIWESAYLCWGTTNSVPNMEEVLPETVSQFTGLYDKNGRKIFEGDIVRYTSDLGNTHTCTVSYHEACAMFVLNFINSKTISDFMISSACACEVIGNIYDNPELLEV